jgi:anti-sigma B factor antagonist
VARRKTGAAQDIDFAGREALVFRPAGVRPFSMPLRIESREVSHVTILDIQGRIVLGEEIHLLRDAVRNLIADGKKKILLNLGDVDYIDSSGVGELVGAFTTVRNAGGELKLLNLTQKVHDVLHVTKLYTVFDIRDDEFTAVKSFDYYFAK